MQFDRVWTGGRLATMRPDLPGLGVIEDGAIATSGGRIAYVGPAADLPAHAAPVTQLGGRWVTPGLIDCHTHLVFAGDRAAEFEQRLAGATYAEIAASGGGILTTVRATRAASYATLRDTALARLDDLIADGVTTVEVKSGYGLDLPHELRLLRVARALPLARAVEVCTTFLGAHVLPADGDRAAHVGAIAQQMIPAVAASGLADAVDAFCDRIAFTVAETETVLRPAQAAGLPIKLHAEQLSHLGGALLAAQLGALSADHLEYATDEDAAAMAASGTVAVLLPGAFHMLRETQRPPIAAFRARGVAMAVATDCNPGSSPLSSLLLAMHLGCVLFGLTVDEAMLGVTRHAATALGRQHDIGTLEVGKRADLAIWSVERLAELPYRMGARPLHARVFAGA